MTARVRIADVRERQRVTVVGKVRLLQAALEAPLSGRPCTAYDARLADRRVLLPDPAVREVDARDFLVEDESGRALVRCRGAHIVLKIDAHYRGVDGELTSRQQAFVARHRYAGDGAPLSFDEGALTPGEVVEVVGTAMYEIDLDPAASLYRGGATRVVFAADAGELRITDNVGR